MYSIHIFEQFFFVTREFAKCSVLCVCVCMCVACSDQCFNGVCGNNLSLIINLSVVKTNEAFFSSFSLASQLASSIVSVILNFILISSWKFICHRWKEIGEHKFIAGGTYHIYIWQIGFKLTVFVCVCLGSNACIFTSQSWYNVELISALD